MTEECVIPVERSFGRFGHSAPTVGTPHFVTADAWPPGWFQLHDRPATGTVLRLVLHGPILFHLLTCGADLRVGKNLQSFGRDHLTAALTAAMALPKTGRDERNNSAQVRGLKRIGPA